MLFLNDKYLINLNNISYFNFIKNDEEEKYGYLQINFNDEDQNFIIIEDIMLDDYFYFIRFIKDFILTDKKYDCFSFSSY